MVGYRNENPHLSHFYFEFIRRSDGGVSERSDGRSDASRRVYQAFRWWGIGTMKHRARPTRRSLSGVPMVGYRNGAHGGDSGPFEFIRRSDGVVDVL